MNDVSMKTLALILATTALGLGCGKKTATAAANPKVAVERGRVAYVKLCATCHGPQANGYAADNAPSLRTTTFLATATDAFLRDGIARGRPGTAMGGYGRAVGGPLGPEDVDALVAFLREGGPPHRELPSIRATGDSTRGKVTYTGLCQRCHGTPTQRSTAVHLANPVFLATASDAFLRAAIETGRPPTSMIPWKGALTPAQIEDVVAYVRSLAVAPAPLAPPPPLEPRTGPVVINPKGHAPDFTLKENLYVSIDQVKEALDKKRRIVICDARAPSDYEGLHITGAISTPYYESRSLDDIPNDGTWVVAYCACPHHVSGEVVAELRKRGFKHTAVIDEGVYAWQQKKYPIVLKPNQPVIPAPPPQPSARPDAGLTKQVTPPRPAR